MFELSEILKKNFLYIGTILEGFPKEIQNFIFFASPNHSQMLTLIQFYNLSSYNYVHFIWYLWYVTFAKLLELTARALTILLLQSLIYMLLYTMRLPSEIFLNGDVNLKLRFHSA